MAHAGYDIEDAIVMNKSSLDRGFGRCVVLRKYGTTMKKYKNRTTDRVVKPVVPPGQVSVAASTIGLMLQPVVIRLRLSLSLSIGSLFMVTDKIRVRVRAGLNSESGCSLGNIFWLGSVKDLHQHVDHACTSVVQLYNRACAWWEYGLGSHTQSSTIWEYTPCFVADGLLTQLALTSAYVTSFWVS